MTSLGFVACSYYGAYITYGNTRKPNLDTFGSFGSEATSPVGAVFLLVPCIFLAVFVHPTLNNDFLSDFSWTISMYLESVAVAPQLFLFQRSKESITMLNAHVIIALGLARIFDGIFWMYSFQGQCFRENTSSVNIDMFTCLTSLINPCILPLFPLFPAQS